MLANIFSSFDLSLCMSIPYAWVYILIPILLIPLNKFFSYSTPYASLFSTFKDLFINPRATSLSGSANFIIVAFTLFIFLNLSGNIPYMFAFSSLPQAAMLIGMPFWAMIVSSSTFLNPRVTFGALLPAGVPFWLAPFLSLVELISTLVRPLTLCLRLIANITAGHVFIALMGTALCYVITALLPFTSIFLIFISMGLTMFEFAVSFIQTMIFTLLLSMYMADHAD